MTYLHSLTKFATNLNILAIGLPKSITWLKHQLRREKLDLTHSEKLKRVEINRGTYDIILPQSVVSIIHKECGVVDLVNIEHLKQLESLEFITCSFKPKFMANIAYPTPVKEISLTKMSLARGIDSWIFEFGNLPPR